MPRVQKRVRAYAGIGSQGTPPAIEEMLTDAAEALALAGWTLRSGGAVGADEACERGCDRAGGAKEIFLPYARFRDHPSSLTAPSPEAMALAAKIHPAWLKCDEFARRAHARNCHQILGANLDAPVGFVLCWTYDGRIVGGTATGLQLAKHYDIPIFDLGGPRPAAWRERFAQVTGIFWPRPEWSTR